MRGKPALLNQQSFREFLLGASDPGSEQQIEEGILDGSIESDLLRTTEDELIDDYLFGKLTQGEQEEFRVRFLSDPERRYRVEFAKTLLRYANAERGLIQNARPAGMAKTHSWGALWRTAALVAMAASMVAAVLVGLQNLRLSNEVKLARTSQDEVNRLRAALAAEKTRQAQPTPTNTPVPAAHDERDGVKVAGSLASFDLLPEATRSLRQEVMLRVPSRAQVVWINLEFSDPLSGKLREELAPRGAKDPLWIQEFTISFASPIARNSIAVPSSVLSPGDYEIKVKQGERDAALQDVQTYSFRVIR
jgi:hypothetical protein